MIEVLRFVTHLQKQFSQKNSDILYKLYNFNMSDDPFNEEKYKVAPGLIYKYHGRALWLISKICAVHCDFCMRGRLTKNKSLNPYLSDVKIDQTLKYLGKNPEIREVILSGGDPLFVPQDYLKKIIFGLTLLQKNNKLDTIRIHTRLPVVRPKMIKSWHYRLLAKIKNPYLVLHINHPSEITKDFVQVSDNFRKKCVALVLSQSVLLKGINDNQETLCELFTELVINGIHPYYLHYIDPVPWAEKYRVSFKRAVSIWQSLRPKLSGLAATAKFVIEAPGGMGKVTIPDKGWNTSYSFYNDFLGNKFKP